MLYQIPVKDDISTETFIGDGGGGCIESWGGLGDGDGGTQV